MYANGLGDRIFPAKVKVSGSVLEIINANVKLLLEGGKDELEVRAATNSPRDDYKFCLLGLERGEHGWKTVEDLQLVKELLG